MSAVRAARARLLDSVAVQIFSACETDFTLRASSSSCVPALFSAGGSIAAWSLLGVMPPGGASVSAFGLSIGSEAERACPYVSLGGAVHTFPQRGGLSGHCSDDKSVFTSMKQWQRRHCPPSLNLHRPHFRNRWS